jgi:very-short-patch-repair endonuclease
VRPSKAVATKRVAAKVPGGIHAHEHGLFYSLLRREGLPLPETEARFHPTRDWRFDFLWRAERVFLEVDGGIWLKGGGRHTRGSGWLKDTDKLNAAAALGYRHLRCTPQQLHDLALIATIRETLNYQG